MLVPKITLLPITALLLGLLLGNLTGWWNRKESLTSLQGSTVLITGSSMGLGEHLAYQFATNGARIIITARSENKLIQVADACRKFGATEVHYFVADMQSSGEVNDLIQFTKNKFHGRLDYLLLNHVVMEKANPLKEDPKDLLQNLRKLYDINFFAYVQLASSFLPILEQSQGRIVTISSIAAKHNFPLFVAYSSTKAAVESFFIGLRQELALKSSNVSITLATLGRIDTPGQRNAVQNVIIGEHLFPAESPESTAEVIVRGAYSRIRDIYHPFWTEGPLCAFIEFPFIRRLFEFGLRFAMQNAI